MLTIEKLVCGLVVWLYVRAGVSREVSNAVLRAIAMIVNSVIALLIAALASHGVKVKIPPLNFPKDVRTAYKRYFPEPEIKREMRCPTCFNRIHCPKDQIILKCPWRTHPNARTQCGADLWKPLQNRKGERVPACLVTTQSVQSWLPSFLSRKVIDDALHETHQRHTDGLDPEMRDVHDSPGWQGMYDGKSGPYNLVFGLYFDEFQVFKLKIAGE